MPDDSAGSGGRGDRPPLRPGLSDQRSTAQRASTCVHGAGSLRPAARSIPSTPTAKRDGLRHDWLPAEPEPPSMELIDLKLKPCPWRPYNAGYVNGGGWYHFYDLATDVAMWGAHTVLQRWRGVGHDGRLAHRVRVRRTRCDDRGQRLSNGCKPQLAAGSVGPRRVLVMKRLAASGSTDPKDGPGPPTATHRRSLRAGLLRDYTKVLAEYTARNTAAAGPRIPRLHPPRRAPRGESGGHAYDEHLPGGRYREQLQRNLCSIRSRPSLSAMWKPTGCGPAMRYR